MKLARGQCLRNASSSTSVPVALTEKSVCGSLAAQSCDGCAVGVVRDRRLELPPAPFGGGVGAEEAFAHVVINADDAQALVAKKAHGLRADEPRGACHQNNVHSL